jgi:hypothetical protein
MQNARDVYARREDREPLGRAIVAIVASAPSDAGPLFDPGNDKAYRHPQFTRFRAGFEDCDHRKREAGDGKRERGGNGKPGDPSLRSGQAGNRDSADGWVAGAKPGTATSGVAENSFFEYLLRLADDRLVLGHRLSEWCGHAPILEEDIALANIALDLIGQASMLLKLAGEVEGRAARRTRWPTSATRSSSGTPSWSSCLTATSR